MGNIQCADTCNTCTCLNLENYNGTECTRILKGEQPNIVSFVGSTLLILTLFFQLGFVKISKKITSIDDLVSETFKYFTRLKDKEDKRFIVVIADSSFIFSVLLLWTGIIWSAVEGDVKSDCSTTEKSSTLWAYTTYIVLCSLLIVLFIIHFIRIKCFPNTNSI